MLRVFSWLLGVLLLEESNYYYMLYGKIKSTVINSSIIQPYNVLILPERQDASVFKPDHEAQLSEAHGVQCVHIHGEKHLTDIPSMRWGESLVWYMLNVLTSEKGDTCGESPSINDNDRKTINVTGSMAASGYYSTSMCHIRPHKWENEIGNAYIWFDLALSGCAIISREIESKSGGCEEMTVGCSSGSGSVNVSSMLSDVPMSGMLSRKHDVYDALDDVPIECTCGSLVHGMDNIPMFGTYDMVSCVTILRVGMRQQSLSIP
jgi:hypothetical protein